MRIRHYFYTGFGGNKVRLLNRLAKVFSGFPFDFCWGSWILQQIHLPKSKIGLLWYDVFSDRAYGWCPCDDDLMFCAPGYVQ